MNPAIMSARDIRFSTATVHDAAAGLDLLLTNLMAWIRRYVVVTDPQAVTTVLWIAHTHAIDAFDCTPYLQITSATKRAGKTRLLEVLEPVVPRVWFTGRTSAAALVRKVDADTPTLLLDESDAAFGGDKEYSEALRGILNSGYRRSGRATICVGRSSKIDVRDFRTFCPKAIAGIGDLPATIADRAIRIELRRRTTDEPVERWRQRDGHREAAHLLDALALWAAKSTEILRGARPTLPSSLGDRQQDVWEPLLAIADLAGSSWSIQARHAAIALAGTVEDQDIVVELLRDVAEIITACSTPAIATRELIEKLVEREDRPWATWRKGDKPITARGLTRLLGPLGIHPDRHLRIARGYRIDAFTDAIARYLPTQVSQCHTPNKTRHEWQVSMRHADAASDECGTQQTLINPKVVTHRPTDHGVTEGTDDGLF